MSETGNHLVIDAGHISIESRLADKKAVQEINAKRKQQYSEADYRRLESMMYDQLSVRLEDAQFVIGTDLKACREALTSKKHDNLHLLERISIDLQVQNSIVPTVYTLARFKISGHLPALQINLSDTKYKSLMRLIDVAIPHFDDDAEGVKVVAARPAEKSAFRLRNGFFGQNEEGYQVDSDSDDDTKDALVKPSNSAEDQFFEAETGDDEVSTLT